MKLRAGRAPQQSDGDLPRYVGYEFRFIAALDACALLIMLMMLRCQLRAFRRAPRISARFSAFRRLRASLIATRFRKFYAARFARQRTRRHRF